MKYAIIFLFIVLSFNIAAADMNVYDAHGQFLGVLVDRQGYFFIPLLNKFIQINRSNGKLYEMQVLFERSDCSGTPYVPFNYDNEIFQFSNRLYVTDNVAPLTKTMNSYIEPNGTCYNVGGGGWTFQFLTFKELTQGLPFTIPVALPLQYNVIRYDRR